MTDPSLWSRVKRSLTVLWPGPSSTATPIGFYPEAAGFPSSPTMPTPQQGRSIPPIYRAINLIARDLARLEVVVERPTLSDVHGVVWVQQPRHPIALAMNGSVSREQSGSGLREQLASSALTYGNGLAIARRRGSEVSAVTVYPTGAALRVVGTDVSYQTPWGVFPQDAVIHLRAPSDHPLWGDSPIRTCAESIRSSLGMITRGADTFDDALPPKLGMETTDPAIPAETVKAIANAFLAAHTGRQNRSRPVVAPAKIQVLEQTLSELEWSEARRGTVADVANIYGVPPQLLGSVHDQAREATIEQRRSYVESCFVHWSHQLGVELGRKLLEPSEREAGLRVRIDVSALMGGSLEERVAAARAAIDAGFMTRNEARVKLLGYEPGPAELDEFALSKNYEVRGGGERPEGAASEDEAGAVG